MGRKCITGGKTRFWWLLGALVLAVALAPGLAQATTDLTVASGSTYDNPTGTSAYDNGYIDGTANCNQGSLTFLTAGQGQLELGTTSTASGVFNLNTASPGTGSLSALEEDIGYVGSGTFTQSGGTNLVTGYLVLAYNAGSSGTYDLSTGSLAANDELIGSGGTGTFTQRGGTNAVNNDFLLGIYSGGTGTYNLSGGSLTARAEYIGLSGSGVFNQTGGTNTISGELDWAPRAAAASTTSSGAASPPVAWTWNPAGSFGASAPGTREPSRIAAWWLPATRRAP